MIVRDHEDAEQDRNQRGRADADEVLWDLCDQWKVWAPNEEAYQRCLGNASPVYDFPMQVESSEASLLRAVSQAWRGMR